MSLQVGLREANQHLPDYIKLVEKGEEILITRHGKPVAKLIGVHQKKSLSQTQKVALKRTIARMRAGFKYDEKTFNREDLYDR